MKDKFEIERIRRLNEQERGAPSRDPENAPALDDVSDDEFFAELAPEEDQAASAPPQLGPLAKSARAGRETETFEMPEDVARIMEFRPPRAFARPGDQFLPPEEDDGVMRSLGRVALNFLGGGGLANPLTGLREAISDTDVASPGTTANGVEQPFTRTIRVDPAARIMGAIEGASMGVIPELASEGYGRLIGLTQGEQYAEPAEQDIRQAIEELRARAPGQFQEAEIQGGVGAALIPGPQELQAVRAMRPLGRAAVGIAEGAGMSGLAAYGGGGSAGEIGAAGLGGATIAAVPGVIGGFMRSTVGNAAMLRLRELGADLGDIRRLANNRLFGSNADERIQTAAEIASREGLSGLGHRERQAAAEAIRDRTQGEIREVINRDIEVDPTQMIQDARQTIVRPLMRGAHPKTRSVGEGIESAISTIEDRSLRAPVRAANEANAEAIASYRNRLRAAQAARRESFSPVGARGLIEERQGLIGRRGAERELADIDQELERQYRGVEETLPPLGIRAPELVQPRAVPLSMRDLQDLKNEFGGLATYGAGEPKLANQAIQDLRGSVNRTMEEALEGAEGELDPGVLERYRQSKRTWGLANEAADWAGDRQLREATNRQFSPTDYLAAIGGGAMAGGQFGDVSATDPTTWVNPLIGAAAGAAANRFLRPREHGAMATFLERINALRTRVPASATRAIQQAASRGPAVLAATNFELEQTDPEYRRAMASGDEEQPDLDSMTDEEFFGALAPEEMTP